MVTAPHQLFERGVKGHLVLQSATWWYKNITDFHTKDRWKLDPVDMGDCKCLLPITKVPAQTKLERLNIPAKSERQSSASLKEEQTRTN